MFLALLYRTRNQRAYALPLFEVYMTNDLTYTCPPSLPPFWPQSMTQRPPPSPLINHLPTTNQATPSLPPSFLTLLLYYQPLPFPHLKMCVTTCCLLFFLLLLLLFLLPPHIARMFEGRGGVADPTNGEVRLRSYTCSQGEEATCVQKRRFQNKVW